MTKEDLVIPQEADHSHRWVIVGHGYVQHGKCKHCGAERDFIPEPEKWDVRNFSLVRHRAPGEKPTVDKRAGALRVAKLSVEGLNDEGIMESTGWEARSSVSKARMHFVELFGKNADSPRRGMHDGVRNAVRLGHLRPGLPETIPALTREESILFNFLAIGLTIEEVAKETKTGAEGPSKRIKDLYTKTGFSNSLQMAAWKGRQEGRRIRER